MAEEQNKQLQNELHKALLEAAKTAKSIGYNPSMFNQMLATEGGYNVAKKLILKTSTGFEKLWELNRLDLSTEAIILKKRFKELFTQEELEIAKARLEDFRYFIKEDVLENITSEISDENFKRFITCLKKKEYIYGISPETKYYIVTFKQRVGHYLIFLMDNHKEIYQDRANGLNEAKYKAFEKLLSIDSNVFNDNKVTMVHYMFDREKPWEKDSPKDIDKALESFYRLRGGDFNSYSDEIKSKLLYESILKDIEAFEVESEGVEGAKKTYLVNKYERDPKNRQKAIEIHGLNCKVCKFNFQEVYGERGIDFIEIHHVKPLSTVGEATEINPKTDLVPLCANCHRMVHRRKDDVMSIQELKELILEHKK